MAVRGLNFAVSLRNAFCRPAVRYVRTLRERQTEVDFDELEGDDRFGGAYASNEKVEATRFGAVRRDKENLPHRHGEFEIGGSEKLLLGFDIPIPKDALPEAERKPNRYTAPESGSKKDGKKKTKKSAKEAEEWEIERKPNRNTAPESESKKDGKKKTKKSAKEAEKREIELRSVRRAESDLASTDDIHDEVNSAFDAVRAELRKKDEIHVPGDEKKDAFGYRILKAEIKPQIWAMPKEEVLKCLMRNILFDSRELFILDKPYGLSMHGGVEYAEEDRYALTTYLDAMAKAFKVEKLYPVHRLDKDVTGVLCIAKSKDIADTVKALFKSRQIKKEYVAITRGVPPALEGVIDSAIAMGSVDGKERMVIVPKAEPGSRKSVPKFRETFPAVTRYKIISSTERVAFVRLLPETGYKHQLRVHLGLGLRCPILGDHKYSNLRDMLPQKLHGEILDSLKVRQQQVRQIPLHLHSRHIVIPGILEDGRDLIVKSCVPTHFKRNLERLKIRW